MPSTLEAVRRLAEQEMRREAPRLDGEKELKRRKKTSSSGDDVDGDGDGDGDGNENDKSKSSTSTSRSWLRFAYDAGNSLANAANSSSSIACFVVSSQIRKEMSAAREARGRLCGLLGIEEAEEEEEDEEKVEGENGAHQQLFPTLSPVKIGCRGLGLLVYRGKKKKLKAGAASRAVEELVRGVLEGKERKKSSDDDASNHHQPFTFVRRVVPVDAAVVEGRPDDGNGDSSSSSSSSSTSAIERLSSAVRSLVSRVDVRSLAVEPSSPLPPSVVKFAVCYRRHVPSEREEEEEAGKEKGGKENAAGETAGTATTNAAAANTAGLACRSAVIKAAAQALAESLPAALSTEKETTPAAAVDLKTPHVVLCIEVLPLSHRCLVATLALVPRDVCDKQLRVHGVNSGE